MNSPPLATATEPTPSADVAKQLLADAKELIALEVELAKNEVTEELVRSKHAAIAAGVAVAAIVLCLNAALVGLILALGGAPIHALSVALVLLLLAVATSVYAYSAIPKRPLGRTRARLEDDARQLKAHVA
jgi:uncharacterized membrane protein YqjE